MCDEYAYQERPERREKIATCAECKKVFWIPDTRCWVYKREVTSRFGDRFAYLCSYSCARKYDGKYEKYLEKSLKEKASKAKEKRR